MKPDLHALRLACEIGLWRHGWVWPCAPAVLLAALAIWAVVVQPEQDKVAEIERRLQALAVPVRVEQAPSTPATPQAQWQALLSSLRSNQDPESIVRRWSALAARHGVRWRQTEFQVSTDPRTGARRLKVVLPVSATYPRLRTFIEAVLRDATNVSVDQILLQRQSSSMEVVETRLTLSVWSAPVPREPTP